MTQVNGMKNFDLSRMILGGLEDRKDVKWDDEWERKRNRVHPLTMISESQTEMNAVLSVDQQMATLSMSRCRYLCPIDSGTVGVRRAVKTTSSWFLYEKEDMK